MPPLVVVRPVTPSVPPTVALLVTLAESSVINTSPAFTLSPAFTFTCATLPVVFHNTEADCRACTAPEDWTLVMAVMVVTPMTTRHRKREH